MQRLPSERPKHAVALETCIEINKYKIYAKFIPFPNNNNLVTYHKILKIGERDAKPENIRTISKHTIIRFYCLIS